MHTVARNYKKIVAMIAIVVVAVLVALATYQVNFASAQPSQFSAGSRTSTASTTPVYMTAGTATSTIVYDSYGVNGTNQSNGGNTWATDSATLLLQFQGSSTLSTLNLNFEYSDDGFDWYQDASTNVNGYASTTLPLSEMQVPQYQWGFSSSTVGGVALGVGGGVLGASGTNNRDTRAITFKTPTRYTRVVLSLKAGGLNGAVWGQIVPKKEQASR